MHNMMTKTRFAWIIALAIQSSTYAQSNDEEPSFRPRSDSHAIEDLKRLRDELNRTSDANGAVNPLGKFLERSARPNQPTLLEIGPSDPKLANRELEPASSKSKPRREIVSLPGPRLTIIQQASPQVRNTIVDGFRPSRFVSDFEATVRPSLQYPVTMASANLPIVGQPSSYIANYQGGPEIPNVVVNPNLGLPPTFYNQPATNANAQPILPSALPIQYPPNNTGGGFPPNGGNSAPILSTPIPNAPPIVNNPGAYNVVPPNYGPPTANPNLPFNPNPAYAAPRSASDSVMPSYGPPSVVNGPPFVSNAPRQFDARNMVACNAYRQSADPCAQPCRSNPNGYASSPYATGGSPFAYTPPTWMPNGRSSGYRPLIGFGQGSYDAYLGRGIVGQPVAYVDGQPVRNFIRYVFP
jgi:hypothetical protein